MDEFLTDPEPYLRRLAEEEIWRKRQRQRMERLRREQLRKDRRRKRLRHNNQGQGVSQNQRVVCHGSAIFEEQTTSYELWLLFGVSLISLSSE